MKREPGISLVVLHPFAQGLSRVGVDPKMFFDALKSDDGADDFVPASRVQAALDAIQKTTGRNAVLAMIDASPLGSFGLFDYLFATSASFGDALRQFRRFYRIMTEIVTLDIIEEKQELRVRHLLKGGTTRIVTLTEFAFAAIVSRARLTLGAIPLLHVTFTHHAEDPRAFESFFRCSVTFGGEIDELVFDASITRIPFVTADATTLHVLEQHAVDLERRLVEPVGLRERVEAAIASSLVRRACNESTIAKWVGVSKRTLQRALAAEGTSLRKLVADVRRDIAVRRLEQTDVPIAQIAFELGFAQNVGFHRAFMRWTGMTPGAFRAASQR